MFWLVGVSHAERWKAFLFTTALADLHTHTHTRARKVTQQWGGKADNEREKGRDLSQAFSPPISPRARPRPNTLPHNTHTAAGRQEHHDLRKATTMFAFSMFLYILVCVCVNLSVHVQAYFAHSPMRGKETSSIATS